MIPLRNSIPSRTVPIVNSGLIAACALMFGLELVAGAGLDDWIQSDALVPARFLTLAEKLGYDTPSIYRPFFTSLFLHAGWGHVVSNLLFLWAFGANVEDRTGHTAYLAFYVLGGLFAGGTHVMAHPTSTVPTLGASGAIAAVMGMFAVLHPGAWVRVWVFPIFFVSFPAIVLLGAWFALQIAMARGDGGTVAWWAHAGGFAFGAVTALVLGLRRPAEEAASEA